MHKIQRVHDTDVVDRSGFAGESRGENIGGAESCAGEENFCAAFAAAVSEQVSVSISEDIVASADISRLTAEDVVAMYILSVCLTVRVRVRSECFLDWSVVPVTTVSAALVEKEKWRMIPQDEASEALY